MLKQAYKTGGFVIGNDGGKVFIESGSWIIRVDEEYLPNKEKAAIIELAGELPAQGEAFECKKDETNQYTVPWNEYWNPDKTFDESGVEFADTGIIMQYSLENLRVMQEKKSGRCVVLSEQYFNLVDINNINLSHEIEPKGPVALTEEGKTLYWKNNIMSLGLCTVQIQEDTETEKRLKYLSGHRFWVEKKG